jgi:hypothetical protein
MKTYVFVAKNGSLQTHMVEAESEEHAFKVLRSSSTCFDGMSDHTLFCVEQVRLTKQEWFDNAVRGLHSQGWEKSTEGSNRCRYTSVQEGKELHCAIGWSCPVAPEDVSVDYLESKGFVRVTDFMSVPTGFDFLAELQGCHDHSRGPRNMALGFEAFGKGLDLMWPTGVPKPSSQSFDCLG